MNAPLMHPLEQERIVFKLNGREVDAFAGETIIEAADRLGVAIPRLCYKPGMRPDGNCRACMVEIKGERVLAPSCCRRPGAGMEVASDSARALHAQKMIIEMLAGDMPAKAYRTDSELAHWQRALGVGKPRGHVLPPFGRRKPTNMRGPDTRRTLLHARSSSKIVRPPMKACDALAGPHPTARTYFPGPLAPINRDA